MTAQRLLFLALAFLSCLIVQCLSLSQLFGGSKATNKNAQARVGMIKSNIRSLAVGTSNGIKAPKSVKEEIANLATELASLNPTNDLTSSKKLEGRWKLLYTSNEGSSAGKLGPFIGRVDQIITLSEKKYENVVRIGGSGEKSVVEGCLGATWKCLNNKEWEVEFLDLQLTLFNSIPVVKQKLTAKGIWKMTYIDDDFRVLFAIGGKNTLNANVYILEKENPQVSK